jgi:hypothetical protein
LIPIFSKLLKTESYLLVQTEKQNREVLNVTTQVVDPDISEIVYVSGVGWGGTCQLHSKYSASSHHLGIFYD